MKLTREEYQYSRAVYNELYVKKSISMGYTSFFGDGDFSFFESQLPDVRFYIYRPGCKCKTALIKEYCNMEWHYKLKIIQEILSGVGYSIDSSSLKRALLYQEGKSFSFLKQFFGTYFLSTFDEENLDYLPYVLQCKKEGNCQKLEQLASIFSTIHEFFDHLKRIEFTIRLYENMPDEPMNRVMITFDQHGTKETLDEKKERIFEQFTLRDDYGTFYFSSNGFHIFIPFYAPFNTIFHEMGHFFFTQGVFLQPKFLFQKDICLIEGIFQSQDNVAIEVFTEFLANHSLAMVSFDSWPYILKERNQYTYLIPLIEPFWNQFRSLIIYYMKENRPDVLLMLLGKNFLEYKRLFECFIGFDSRISPTDLNIASYYIEQMKNHLIAYETNYVTCFENQVRTLKSNGHRVRILKPGYQKLMEEERFISNVLNTL